MHHKHLTMKHRIILAAVLSVGGFLAWYVTHVEAYFKLFELSAAPFMDKLIFAVGGSE